MVRVKVNGNIVESQGLVKDALVSAGIKINKFLEEDEAESVFMPCDCGGCWSCAVKINGRLSLSCNTPLEEDMDIQTIKSPDKTLRVVSSLGAHTAGGVGTPYFLKKEKRPVEIVVFTHGCNLRCPQCQNSQVAFTDRGNLLEPQETSQILSGLEEGMGINTITFSGGESTLNPTWLLKTIEHLKKIKNKINIHVDTNGTILTPEYMDKLIKSGVNRLGIDLKGGNLPTFQLISGVQDPYLARKYLDNSWRAVEYLIKNYNMEYVIKSGDKYQLIKGVKNTNKPSLFLGIGIPYNKDLISKNEIIEMGMQIKKWDSKIQVCVLDYRPEFKRKDLIKPDWKEMIEIKNILNDLGLETVLVQSEKGYYGP